MPLSNISKILGTASALLGASVYLLSRLLPWPVTAFLGYCSASGLVVAVAANGVVYIPTSGRWVGKDPKTGCISPLGYVLQFPYHAQLRARIAMRRRKSKEALYNEIVPYWYLGGWPLKTSDLPLAGHLARVDLTASLPARGSGPYHNVAIYDTMGPTVEQTEGAVQWALQQRQQGHDVYIFCQNGHGRSGVVMAAAMLASGQAKTPEDAVALLKQKRPKVRFNAAQQVAFDAWVKARQKKD